MKIEDLTKLGIAEEVAKQVTAMNEAEVAAEAKKLTDKEAELTMATDKIKELTETVKKFDGVDIDKLKSDLEAANKKYADDTAAMKLDNAIALALADSGALDKDIVSSQIDKSILKLDKDGGLVGFTEQLDKLKADKAFLFGGSSENKEETVNTGFYHSTPTSDSSFGFNFTGVRAKPVEK